MAAKKNVPSSNGCLAFLRSQNFAGPPAAFIINRGQVLKCHKGGVLQEKKKEKFARHSARRGERKGGENASITLLIELRTIHDDDAASGSNMHNLLLAQQPQMLFGVLARNINPFGDFVLS